MLKLPHLDDKPYEQILGEAVGRIPQLTDKWTDFNEHDPGITLLELFASLSEMQNYYLDQTGEKLLEAYFDLMGVPRQGDLDARAGQFVHEMQRPQRAVTRADYEFLALHAPGVGAGIARAAFTGGYALVAVCQKGGAALNARELAALREYLEEYRLLGVRLRVVPARGVEVRARLAVVLSDAAGDVRGREAALGDILARAIDGVRRKELGTQVDKERVMASLLAASGVRTLKYLTLSCAGEGARRNESGDILADFDVLLRLQTPVIDFFYETR